MSVRGDFVVRWRVCSCCHEGGLLDVVALSDARAWEVVVLLGARALSVLRVLESLHSLRTSLCCDTPHRMCGFDGVDEEAMGDRLHMCSHHHS